MIYLKNQIMVGYMASPMQRCASLKENFRGTVIDAVEEFCRQSKEMYKNL